MPTRKHARAHAPRKAPATAHARKASAGHPVAGDEAIAQLTADHAQVKKMFKQYERLAKDQADASERKDLALAICVALTAHAKAEEAIFYPAARAVIDDETLVDEAEVEHATAKELIAQIQESSADDPLFDAKVKVLGEYISHHVAEEESEMFPKVRKAKVDTVALGEQIAARKAQVVEEMQTELAED